MAEPSLGALRQRRTQLSLLLLFVLVALVVVTALAPFGPEPAGSVDPGILKTGLVILSATFGVYALEKERALRRLEAALLDEHGLATEVRRESERLAELVDAALAVSGTLDVDRVSELTLEAALRLSEATTGAVFLDRGELVPTACRADVRRLQDLSAQARHAIRSGAVTRAHDDAGETIALPLAHERAAPVAVLVVAGISDADDFALRHLETFARSAASALEHARAYRAEQLVSEQFPGLQDVRQEFGWLNAET